MLGQAGAVSELAVLLHLAELIPGYDRLLEILGSDDDSLCKVVKHLAGKRLVLTQKISVRARTKMERFFSQNGTSVADRGTPRPLIVLSKWNNGRTKLERPSLKTELASFSL